MAKSKYSTAEKADFKKSMSKLDKGGLHRALHVPDGEPIPADKLAAAKNSKLAHVRKMANFAANAKKWK